MWEGSSGLYPVTAGLLALVEQGCTKKPESYPLSSLRVDYQTWNCQQLANGAAAGRTRSRAVGLSCPLAAEVSHKGTRQPSKGKPSG